MKHIASCSFGKDSIATILLAIENNEPLDGAVFSEVMFDLARNISGENPEHIEWIYTVAIPKLAALGCPVEVVRAERDYMSCFHNTIKSGKNKGKLPGWPIGGMCVIQSQCKIPPVRKYYKRFDEGYSKFYSFKKPRCREQKIIHFHCNNTHGIAHNTHFRY